MCDPDAFELDFDVKFAAIDRTDEKRKKLNIKLQF